MFSKKFSNLILTIGMFDGLHQGHRRILERIVREAKKIQGTSAVLTFCPHPDQFFSRRDSSFFLLPLKEKITLLKKSGIDRVIVLDFTEIRPLSPRNFVKRILREKLGADQVVVGSSFLFGKGNAGTPALLKKIGPDFKLGVEIIPLFKVGRGVVSSSRIRSLLKQGRIKSANSLLGYPYSLSGKVVKGAGRGERLGFPTANLKTDPDILLPRGVFVVVARIKDRVYPGLANIGFRPTFGKGKGPEDKIVTEVHLFNLSRKIYGEKIRVFLVNRLREEKRYKNEDNLISRLAKDKKEAESILHKNWDRLVEEINKSEKIWK